MNTIEKLVEEIRASLHQEIAGVDQKIDSILNHVLSTMCTGTEEDNTLTITAERQQSPFTYNFPTGPEPMRDACWYSVIPVTSGIGPLKMLLAKTDRMRRGAQRVAWVVFGHQKTTNSPTSTQICAEFTQTDDADLFSWEIPDPANPQRALKDGMSIPQRFADKTVQRTDKLYSSVKHGPTLRLVVHANEIEAMLEAGYWAAQLRNRFK